MIKIRKKSIKIVTMIQDLQIYHLIKKTSNKTIEALLPTKIPIPKL